MTMLHSSRLSSAIKTAALSLTLLMLVTANSAALLSVTASPTPPQAAFTYYPVDSYVNMSITFDASASTTEGPYVTIVDYEWNFGDGSPVVNTPNSVTSHTFSVVNSYLVTLKVTDNQGLWSTTSKTIVILPPTGPTADFTWYPSSPRPNQTMTFDAGITRLGWNGSGYPQIVNYVWNFGDSNVTSGYYPTIVHTYTAIGNYTVRLNVTDASLLTGNATHLVMVRQTTLTGDVNGDGTVNILDAILMSNAFLTTPGSPNWNPNADLNVDNTVNILDAIILANHFGQTG